MNGDTHTVLYNTVNIAILEHVNVYMCQCEYSVKYLWSPIRSLFTFPE